MKAGRANDRVDLALFAILGCDAAGPHFANVVGDDLDIRLGNRRVEVIGQQNALAARGLAPASPGAAGQSSCRSLTYLAER